MYLDSESKTRLTSLNADRPFAESVRRKKKEQKNEETHGCREQDAEAGGKCRSDYRYEFADAGKYGKDGGVGKMEKFKTGKDNGRGYDADGELAADINPQ